MRGRLRLLTCAALFCLCTGCAINPVTGDEDLMFYSEERDLAIGRKYAPKVEKELGGRIDNQDLQDYIDRIGQRIARVSHRPDLEYHFVALEDESVNALALPGGYIFVLRGTLEKLKTKAQLAAILGHEVAHVVARDSMAALSRKQATDLLVVPLLLTGAPGAAAQAATITALLLNLRYSRQDEYEADLAGLDYMVAAGYNPRGAVELIQILEAEHKTRPIEFFSTHPSPKNRRAYMIRRIQQKYRSVTTLKTGKEDYETGVLQNLGSKPTKRESQPPTTE